MTPKTRLEAGDTLARDLLHPQSGQILLPAGTVLTDSYIFKIELLRLTDVALECLLPPEEPAGPDAESADTAPREPLDFELFSRAKEAMVRLEEMARAFGTPRAGKVIDSYGTRVMLSDLVTTMIERLMKIMPGQFPNLRCHDYYLYSHPINTAMIALCMGLALHYDRTRLIGLGTSAMLADLGKFRLPRSLIHKSGELTDDERRLVRDHGRLGAEVVGDFNWTRAVALMVMECHHERVDGSGYPRGLRGGQIAEEALIVGLADSYDAMISDLPYRRRLDPAVAHRIIQSHAGKEWEAGLVWAFSRYVAPYPVGTQVKLNTGEEARVVAVRPGHMTRPIVHSGAEEIDLVGDKKRRIVGAVIPRKYHREKISLPVEVRLQGREVFHGTLHDLSLNGLSIIDAPGGAEPGTEVEVTIPIPSRRASIEVKGNVVWTREAGAGVQIGVAFKQVSATNKEALLETIWGGSGVSC